MTYERGLMAGGTDYTGVPLPDILLHLDDWISGTNECLSYLKEARGKVRASSTLLDNPEEIDSYIQHFISLLDRYAQEFVRLRRELPESVSDAHVDAVRQLYESAVSEDRLASEFKKDWLLGYSLRKEVRPLLEGIYRESRWQLQDMLDLSNLAPRLRALRAPPPSADAIPELELKPNFFGVGLNANRLLGRLRS